MKKSKLMKKISNFFSLPISLTVTLKLSLRSHFSAKKHFFAFCRNFGFNLEISSKHYSQLKKYLKVDPETRSHDILTKTHKKILTIPNLPVLGITLENRMNIFQIVLSSPIHKQEKWYYYMIMAWKKEVLYLENIFKTSKPADTHITVWSLLPVLVLLIHCDNNR